ncbi:MAG: hypothetical protein Tsb0014_30970 [Pleurocapsa sp.]
MSLNLDAYEKGKECALRGGQHNENPFFSGKEPELENEGIIWLRGFQDYKIPDPNCSRCHGTGKLPTDAGKYGIINFDCLCNKKDGSV